MEKQGFHLYGTDIFGNAKAPAAQGALANNFIMPPFSVLSARDGAWQDRKRAWLSLGIKSEVGRGASPGVARADVHRIGSKSKWNDNIKAKANHATPGGSARPACNYKNRERGSGSGSAIPGTSANVIGGLLHSGPTVDTRNGDIWDGGRSCWQNEGTSIFDPVLCELAYKWFCPTNGQVVDPFAGGSVRGIVASLLGYKYYGIELRQEQVDANKEQYTTICPEAKELTWACGDAIDELSNAPDADFIFTCPPYGDLERYSDDPRDLSTMEYHTFIANYKRIILRVVQKLKQNRFACFVVGDFRDPKTGNYRNFIGDTIAGFIDAGCGYYNEAILVTAVGSLPIRITKQFTASRKLGKTHQNMLVFIKGDPKEASKLIQPFEL